MAKREGLPAPEKNDFSDLVSAGQRVLTTAGQFELDELIREKKIQEARELILCAIDDCFDNKVINFQEAFVLYAKAGVSPERASDIRQERFGAVKISRT